MEWKRPISVFLSVDDFPLIGFIQKLLFRYPDQLDRWSLLITAGNEFIFTDFFFLSSVNIIGFILCQIFFEIPDLKLEFLDSLFLGLILFCWRASFVFVSYIFFNFFFTLIYKFCQSIHQWKKKSSPNINKVSVPLG